MAEGGGQLVEQAEVVVGRARVGDDHLRHELAQRLRRVQAVLVDVDQHVGRGEPAQLGQVHVLGAADLGDALHRIGRVNAKPGARHNVIAQPQGDQQLGQAGHQAGDAQHGPNQAGGIGGDSVSAR